MRKLARINLAVCSRAATRDSIYFGCPGTFTGCLSNHESFFTSLENRHSNFFLAPMREIIIYNFTLASNLALLTCKKQRCYEIGSSIAGSVNNKYMLRAKMKKKMENTLSHSRPRKLHFHGADTNLVASLLIASPYYRANVTSSWPSEWFHATNRSSFDGTRDSLTIRQETLIYHYSSNKNTPVKIRSTQSNSGDGDIMTKFARKSTRAFIKLARITATDT